MARLNSYHLPPEGWPERPQEHGDASVRLAGPEARHLLSVLRAKSGETVRLFDGRGRHGIFAITQVHGKNSAELRLVSQTNEPAPLRGVTLALGWNKASRRDWLLEKSVELGALGIVFWEAARSQGAMPPEIKESWADKLIQSAKQCGAAWLPELSLVRGGVAGLLRLAADFDGCYLLYEAADAADLLNPADLARGRSLVVLGPEGGLEESEAQALKDAGFKIAGLGPRPLRWETAALSCLCLAHHAGLKP